MPYYGQYLAIDSNLLLLPYLLMIYTNLAHSFENLINSLY